MKRLGSAWLPLLFTLTVSLPAAEIAEPLVWNLADDFQSGSQHQNPNRDHYAQPTWHFLRTSNRQHDVAKRSWLRDGQYTPLSQYGTRLFDLPVDAWVKHAAGDYRQPVIGRFGLRHELGLRFESGDIFFAPGHDDACVLGWRSPVAGTLTIEGSFQHAEQDPEDNSGIRWYIERGRAPGSAQGNLAAELAAGASRFGTDTQVGSFHVRGQKMEPGDFIYFIVDAKSDGSEQPQQGDFTRLRARLTMRDATWPPVPRFEQDVHSILATHCHHCHGEDLQESALDLRTVTAMLRGGESGPAIVRGDPRQSYLLQLLQRGDMPPDGEDSLSVEEVSTLARWIHAGAPTDEQVVHPSAADLVTHNQRRHWAFQKLRQHAPPILPTGARAATPIDNFMIARLHQKGLGYTVRADRSTLIRRASLDLVGLPPSPEQVEHFLSDTGPGAYERLVDDLLESSHFGERWGRHWLDVVGYADTVGFDQDSKLIVQTGGKWRYRDYVIRAFNEDKPYNQFVTEQLAGDEAVSWRDVDHFTPEIRDNLTATGFLRTARDQTHEPESNIPLSYFGVLHDTVQIVCNSLLGLTAQCARCHSHKFDPIPQQDYYRLMAAFTPAYNPHRWKPVHAYKPYIDERSLIDVSEREKKEIQQYNAGLDRQLSEWKPEIETILEAARPALREKKLESIPAAIREDVSAAIQTDPEQRSELQTYLADKFKTTLAISRDELLESLHPTDAVKVANLQGQVDQIDQQRRSWGKIQALYDVGPPPATFLLKRGEYQMPGREVAPGFLRVLCESDEAALARVAPSSHSSGRRTALARWLVDSTSPAGALVARVMVNRIWQHLLGTGLVPSPEDFGKQGQPPTHPELLEWISQQFVAGGWRIKPLIKLIILSDVYQQSSHMPPVARGAGDPALIDPANTLLWRMRLRRLEAEILRDSILAVSGKLNTTAGGPPVLTTVQPDGKVVINTGKLRTPADQSRRSIYLLSRRAYNLSMLSVFDQPLISTTCARRDTSAVPLQSLTMLNGDFVTEHAGYFAQRVLARKEANVSAEITAAFQIALSRSPNQNEIAACQHQLASQHQLYRDAGLSAEESRERALISFCHTLLNTSEFLYAE